MAHFVVVVGEADGFFKPAQFEKEVGEFISQAGHTVEVWRPETAKTFLRTFLRRNLRRPEPLAVIYAGHGWRHGWSYGHLGLLSYWTLARWITNLRRGNPTALINCCCYSGSLARWMERTTFDRKSTIVLTAGTAERVSYTGESFEESPAQRVLSTWFLERRPFHPFEYDDNALDAGVLSFDDEDERWNWEHWRRDGPERYGPMKIDEYFFATAKT